MVDHNQYQTIGKYIILRRKNIYIYIYIYIHHKLVSMEAEQNVYKEY
jgi:hypothetical protein